MAIVKRERKDGSYTYQVKVWDAEGNLYDTSSFSDISLAEAEELRLKALKRKGAGAFTQDAKSISLNDYWEVWSVENRNEVSRGWRMSQDQMFRDYVRPVIGSSTLSKIDTVKIGRVFTKMKERGLSDQMRKHVYSLLRKMFGDAVEYYEMLASCPVKPRFHRPKVSARRSHFLIPAQAFRLLDEAKKHPHLGPPIWLQTLAGLRTEAMIALAWSSIQWEMNQILICRAWKKKIRELADFPKGMDWEVVPLAPMLAEYLWGIWQASDQDRDGFVCRGRSGKMVSHEAYHVALRKLCRKAGVPEITPHELRHTCSEIYVQAGASGEDLRRLLNHASLSTTRNYIHRTEERLSAIAANIGRPLLSVIEGSQDTIFPKVFPNGKKQAECRPQEGESLAN